MDLRAILKKLALFGILSGVVTLFVVGILPGTGVLPKSFLPEISLAAENIPLHFLTPIFGEHDGHPPSIPNTLPSTWLTMAILITIGIGYKRASDKNELTKLQIAVELVAEGVFGFVKKVGGKHARDFFPLVTTFFLFITISNWCGILPGFGSVGVWVEHHQEEVLVPFFRSANSHLSTTLALAIVSVGASQYFGFKYLGASYSRKYLNFRATSKEPDYSDKSGIQKGVSKFARGIEAVVNGIVGLLEIILEFLKVLPFSFRLFGNIFAGEVLIFVVSYLFVFVFPIVFLGLEIFIGLIQGLVFSMLTLVFFSVATTAHH
ncbi:MAG: ATP synthase subunit a [Chloroflexi bacterium]|nr:ATP synthase subunit a [Chloroflexota bacterium]